MRFNRICLKVLLEVLYIISIKHRKIYIHWFSSTVLNFKYFLLCNYAPNNIQLM